MTTLVCILVFAASCAKDEPVRVLAAANLAAAFGELASRFEAANPGTRIELTFASSGALRAQIEAGIPADVFASACGEDMDRLASSNLIVAGTRRNFAGNRMVLICPAGSKAVQSAEDLAKDSTRRVALGDPAHVPAGRYARDALQVAGLWESVSPKVVKCESVQQVLALVARGEVDAGIVYRTDALIDGSGVRVAWEAPEASGAGILFPIAVLSASTRGEAAESFVRFVCGPDGRTLLESRGYSAPARHGP